MVFSAFPAWLQLAVAAPISIPGSTVHLETAHYDLRVEGPEEEAVTFGKILEAAWPTFRGFFHGEPALPNGERLAIRVFDTQEACLVGAMNDKADMPPKKHPAWFSPGNGKVYLYRTSGAWFTRYLVIYGACLQFHGLLKPKSRDLDEWYTHGIAESFAVHTWDGERLELAASPPIAAIDHPARALSALGGKRIGLDPFTDERLEDPSVRWAVVRFATAKADGPYRQKFEKLALGATGSKVSGHDFMRSLGAEPAVSAEFSVWLLSAQMPLEIVDPEWEAFSDDRIVGRAAEGEMALCAAKPEFDTLRVEIDTPSEADAVVTGVPGVLLAFQDDRNYLIARLRPPVVYFEHVQAGRQRGVDSRPIERPGPRTLVSVARRENAFELEINGKRYDPFELSGGRVGLAAVGGPVTFRDLKCR